MGFRDDILRGVRLFAITFAGILLCVFAYRMLRPPYQSQNTSQEVLAPPQAPPAPPETAADVDPPADASTEPHGLVVPPPPPVGGAAAPARRVVARPRTQDVPPPPPVVRANRAPAPPKRAFESTVVGGALPSTPGDTSVESTSPTSSNGVGYKSLIEANANRPQEQVQPVTPAASDEPAEKPAKGNRFFRAVGKIFRGGKKEPPATALRPNQE